MKFIYSVTLLFSTCLTLFGQGTYEKVFNFGRSNISKVVGTHDSGHVILSQYYNLGFNIELTKVDKYGTPVWSKYYGGNGLDRRGNSIINTSDSGFAIAGSGTAAALDMVWMKLDKSGNLEWSKRMSTSDNDRAISILQTKGDKYMVMGKINNSNIMYLARLDPLGNLIWGKRYVNPLQSSRPNSMIEISPNQFFISGGAHSQFSGGEDIELSLVDSLGVIIWSKFYGSNLNDYAISSVKTVDNNILVTGYTENFGVGERDIFLMKVDITGNVIWFKTYGTFENDVPASIAINSLDEVIISGWIRDTASYFLNEAFLLKTDSQGNILGSRKFGGSNSKAYDAICTEDNRILTTGYDQVNGYKSYLMKTNMSGFNSCSSDFFQFEAKSSALVSNHVIKTLTGDTLLDSISIFQHSKTNTVYTSCTDSCEVNASFHLVKSSICEGDTIVINNNSNFGLSNKWYLNGQLIDSSQNLVFIATTAGQYDLKLLVSNGQCADEAISQLKVSSVPTANYNFNSQGLVVQFSHQSTGGEGWFWDFGDGDSSDIENPTHVYDDVGNYTVCLTTYNDCYQTTSCKLVKLQDTLGAKFQKTYHSSSAFSSNDSQWINDVLQTKDGNYVTVGRSDKISNGGYVFISKYDKKGNGLWSKEIGVNLNSVANCIIESKDQGFLIGANSTQNNHPYLVKLDKDGNFKWLREISGSAIWGVGFLDIIQLEDSSYVATGEISNKLVVFKFNEYGLVEWANDYPKGRRGRSIVQAPDGGFVITGRTAIGNKVYILKIDSMGAVLWSKSYGGSNGETGFEICNAGNDYLITGITESGGSGSTDILVMKINQSGTKLWSKSYSGIFTELGLSIFLNRSGDIFVVAGANNSRPYLLKLQPNGDIIWDKHYTTPPLSFGNSFGNVGGVLTHDDGVVIASAFFFNSRGKKFVQLIKVDTAGSSGCYSSAANLTQSNAIISTAINNDSARTFISTLVNQIKIPSTIPIHDSVFCYTDEYCPPTAYFTSTINVNQPIFIDSSLQAETWRWDLGNGSFSNLQNPVHHYLNSGTYYVCLTVSNGCGTDTYCDSVVVTCSSPVSKFSYTDTLSTASFSDSSLSTNLWYWDFGDGGFSHNQNPTHTYSSEGTYYVCLWARKDCGLDIWCDSVQITCPPPVSAFSYSDSLLNVSFSDSSTGANTWLWDFGDGIISTQQNPSHNYSSSGNYDVCLEVTGDCGTIQTCQTITVICPNPISYFQYNDSLLLVSFLDSSLNSVSWHWDFGDGDTSNLQNPSHLYSSIGHYQVCLVAQNSCGSDTICDSIFVDCPLPSANYVFTLNNLNVTFQDSSIGSNSWYWDFGDGNSSTSVNPVHSYSSSGKFFACLTVTNNCGSSQKCDSLTLMNIGLNSIEVNKEASFYPNPTKFFGYIDLPEASILYPVQLLFYDYKGQLIFEKIAWSEKIKIDVQGLSSGMYFFQVISSKEVIYSGRFIVN